MAKWPQMVALEGSGCPPPRHRAVGRDTKPFSKVPQSPRRPGRVRSRPGDRGGSAWWMGRARSPPRAPVAGGGGLHARFLCVLRGGLQAILVLLLFAGPIEGPPSGKSLPARPVRPPPGIRGPCPDTPTIGPISRPQVECPGSPNFSRQRSRAAWQSGRLGASRLWVCQTRDKRCVKP